MKRFFNKKLTMIAVATIAVAAVGAPQLKQLIKAGGVLFVVNNYGKEINKSINKLWGRSDSQQLKTKVVPIFSVSIGKKDNAIGAAQVMGPPSEVDKVVAVAQPEVKLLGELRVRALIPVSSKNVIENIQAVDGVGVSGIVDIKL